KLAEAEEELQPLVEKGDPEAMFWIAKIIYRSSIKDTPKALALLKESAKTNPYAAMALFPNNEQCQMYFPSECSEKWVEQAKKLFLEDAKNGDVRAIFYKEKLKKNIVYT
ncbi:TPA: sel1 repeat family protein, partial [Photobacterium damselae subsp. damselae]